MQGLTQIMAGGGEEARLRQVGADCLLLCRMSFAQPPFGFVQLGDVAADEEMLLLVR